MAKGKGTGWAFGPVNDANVEQVFKNLTIGWYLIAAVQFVAVSWFVITSGWPAGDYIDAFAALAAGYYLKSRRSRTLALALMVYSLVTLIVTLGGTFGLPLGGTNVLLVAALLYLSWRSIWATWFYQRRRCAEVRWAPTALILVAACFVTAVAFIAVGVAETNLSPAIAGVSRQMRYFLYAAALFFPPALLTAVLTHWWPFTEPDAACPWPPKPKA